MKNSILTFTFGFCSVLFLLSNISCTSMKTLDNRATAFVNHWKGKSLEEFVKANPDIHPFEVIDLGMGKRRHVFSYREPTNPTEILYNFGNTGRRAYVTRFIYLFVNQQGIIYDASWQTKLNGYRRTQ